jgi:predicted nucleotidyltransferase
VLENDDRAQLDRLIAIVQDVLGPVVAGAYLFGSATLGGLRPASDLDVLVVSARPTTRDERERLVERLCAISGRLVPEGRWRRVEVTIVAEREIRPWRYPPRMDFQYGDWLRSAFERGDLLVAMVGHLDELAAELDGDEANVILTLARVWATVVTGEIHSKDAAADWVLERLPEEQRPVLVRARGIYLGEEDEGSDGLEPQVQSHVDYVTGAIRRAAPAGS